MAEITKPLDINKIWASAGDVLAPSDSKIATGWQVEIPPRQYFNYIDWKQDQAIAHINQHGIAVWDNTTEYQWSSTGTKSICMGSDGTIYRTKQISINQNPVTDTTDTYWEIAFANVSDFYTQTQSDARYLQKSANLSDLTNTVTARTNLSVYSQSQVDTKTTVASSLQTQQQASNTVLVTPLGLGTAFQGANQVLSAAGGFQKFPGGLQIAYGLSAPCDPGTGLVDITFGSAFTAVYSVIAMHTGTDAAIVGEITAARTNTTTRIKIMDRSGLTAARTVSYQVIGKWN